MNNTDILFASIIGGKAFETLERLELVENELTKHVLPAIPFLPFRDTIQIQNKTQNNGFKATIWEADSPQPKEKQFFPLSFSFSESGVNWLFPYEPLVSISGGNNIVKRNVSKIGTDKKGNLLTGTIKERWSQKDYEITITGVLIGKKLNGRPEDCYPKKKLTELFEFLTAQKIIYCYCHLFEPLGINQLVIEDFSFPFTKGENVQAYEIKAVSDSNHKLLLEI
jgi:hypothetical protein